MPSAVAAELAETASLESCLARVITMRDEFVQRRQSVGLPWQQQQKMNRMGDVGASDGRFLNANSPQPSITSAISSECYRILLRAGEGGGGMAIFILPMFVLSSPKKAHGKCVSNTYSIPKILNSVA